MFWNDLKQIKAELIHIKHSQSHMSTSIQQISQRVPLKCKGLVTQECHGINSQYDEGECGFSRIELMEHSIEEIKESLDDSVNFGKYITGLNDRMNAVLERLACLEKLFSTLDIALFEIHKKIDKQSKNISVKSRKTKPEA